MTVELEGSWRLLAVRSYVGGVLENSEHNGPSPVGFIHYLRDHRVAVLVADGGRMRGAASTRQQLTATDHAKADATFNAYGGVWSREGSVVTHRVDICSFQGDVGADYVREIEVEGEHLVLCTPVQPTTAGDRVVKLTWERLPALGSDRPT
jgi:Lipocalin-like domain